MVRVMASGVFDILHTGHIHYLTEAKSLGDELFVVVATDNTVRKKKHEPITSESMRLELVRSLKPVDYAYLGREGDIFDIVKEIKPDIIALGYDQHFDEESIVKELKERGLGVKIVRISEFDHDLNGTKKIIQKIVDWYTFKKKMDKTEGDR
ncbi:MAG TPA: adenylyltransferase/cytidyltransferase family protein [Methanomassiliicoccales archaeon]|nr:adenylyltransferase/cytidyltransferase family protein [Methanomassiliicoccales archaeon]